MPLADTRGKGICKWLMSFCRKRSSRPCEVPQTSGSWIIFLDREDYPSSLKYIALRFRGAAIVLSIRALGFGKFSNTTSSFLWIEISNFDISWLLSTLPFAESPINTAKLIYLRLYSFIWVSWPLIDFRDGTLVTSIDFFRKEVISPLTAFNLIGT